MKRQQALNQQQLITSLPRHLRQFVRKQDQELYSPQDHAVWRFILHELSAQLSETAHPVYQEGLRRTGISLEHIPSIDDMNRCLADLGWAAVVVDGFIPPAIFMEFQARRILPIALDMRRIEHLEYTPAPDIVHESAGHAPFLVDVDYAEFLQRFGEIGMRAIASEADHAVYEAIRHLSIVKEAADSQPLDIAAAESALQQALEANDNSSEAALLARLHWWTVEYGLVGTPQDYRIFGAGLLSSLGESKTALDDEKVEKRVLSLDAINTAYDITQAQPQLFVARSCKHLSQVLESFAQGMAFQRGGRSALEKAIAAATVCSAQYDSGLQVSGQLHKVLYDAMDQPIYLATTGPTQLAFREHQLYRHGIEAHAEGFGSPIGQIVDMPRDLWSYSADELAAYDIRENTAVRLEFVSGVAVDGFLDGIFREAGRNLIFSFVDCRVSGPNDELLFDPAWGCYDMAVGSRIVSVFGGAADRETYDLYSRKQLEATPHAQVCEDMQPAMQAYQQIRSWREGDLPADKAELRSWLEQQRSQRYWPQSWLLQLDALELCLSQGLDQDAQALSDELTQLATTKPELKSLIQRGLQRLQALEQ